MNHKEKKQFYTKIRRVGFLFSCGASIFFFGLFLIYSLTRDFKEGGQYLEGMGMIVAADMGFLLIALGMAFLFIAFFLKFGTSRKKRLF